MKTIALPALLLAFAVTTAAAAEAPNVDTEPPAVTESTAELDLSLTGRSARGFAALDRPAGIAEIGFGWLTLPGVDVCVARTATACEQGDTSPLIDAWQLYRVNKAFAAGAGITLGLVPTQDAPARDPEGVQRDHSRGYFSVEATARYYPYVGERVEVWTGLIAGLVVVSDSFVSTQGFNDEALVGPRGVTIRTEGYSLGLGAGAAIALSQNWATNVGVRYGNWFLPTTPQTDAFGDEASLTGRSTMFSFVVGIAYRTIL